jgi:hypothetical protein
MNKTMLLIAVMTFVSLAHAGHHRRNEQHHRQTGQPLRCPELVEHAYPSTYGQPVPYSPIVYSDNGVLKCLTQDGYDMRWYPSNGGG